MGFRFREKFRLYGPELILEALEDRIVLDASIDPSVQENQDDVGADPGIQTDAGSGDDATSDGGDADESILEQDLRVVLVSNAIDEIEGVSGAVVDNTEIIIYDSRLDSLKTINAMLDELVESAGREIGTLAIVGHGDEGLVQIGADQIGQDNIAKFTAEWEALGANLSEDGQIQLYGCSVAGDSSGEALIDQIAVYTGADVFASSDDTGGKTGNWDLEYSTRSGSVSEPLLDAALLSDVGSEFSFPGRSPLDDPATYDTYTGQLDSSDGFSVVRTGSYADVWTFTLTEETAVSLGMQTHYPGDSGDPNYVDCYLFLYSGLTPDASNEITHNDDWGGGTQLPEADAYDSIIQVTLGAGAYSIETTTYGNADAGPYDLLMAFDTPPDPLKVLFPGTPPLNNPDNYVSLTGALEITDNSSVVRSGRYADDWSFTLTESARVSIGMQTLHPQDSGNPDYVDSYLHLFSGLVPVAGNLITYNDDWGGGDAWPADTLDAYIQSYTLGPGDYSVENTSYSAGDVGDYKYAIYFNYAPDANPIADPPAETEDFGTTDYDVSGSFTDAAGDTLTYELGAPTYHDGLQLDGLTIDANTGVVTFTSHQDSYGSVDIPVRAYDGAFYSDFSTLAFTVTPVNDSPIADDQSITVDEDDSITFRVWGHDPDQPDEADVSFDWTATTNGTLTTDGVVHHDGNGDYYQEFTYEPDDDYFGADSFDFTFTTPAPGTFTDGQGEAVGTDTNSSRYTRFIEFGDVDNDGDLDMVSSIKGGINRVYLNDGDGGFDDALEDFGSNASRSVQLADINSDGWLDAVEADSSGSSARYYLNDGETAGVWQGFASGQGFGTSTDYAYSVAVGDVNNDGWLDVVTGNRSTTTKLYLNQGESGGVWQGFSGAADIGSETVTTYEVKLADVDDNGWLDVVTGNDEVNRLYLNDGTGGFTTGAGTAIGSDNDNTRSIEVGDVDGDGWLDVVAGNDNATNKLYLNDGAGGFASAPGTAIGSDTDHTYGIKLADINHDGRPDVISGNQGSSGEINRIYLNDGVGGFTTGQGTALGSDVDRTYSVEVGDVNGDGWLDIMAGNRGAVERLYLNLTTPETSDPATVTITVDPVHDWPIADSDTIWVVVNDPRTFQVFAHDADMPDVGLVAIEVRSGYDVQHGVLTPDGGVVDLGGGDYSRTFIYTPGADYWGADSFEFTFTTPSGAWRGFVTDGGTAIGAASDAYDTRDLELVDVDQDGTYDFLVTANSDDFSGDPNLIYAINPDGTFEDGVRLTNASGDHSLDSYKVVTGDMNGDGYVDLIFGNQGDNATIHFWDESTGQYEAGVEVADTSGDYAAAIDVGDVDNDGDIDIVIGGADIHYVFGNHGDGTFEAVSKFGEYGSLGSTSALVLADLDNDGWLDVMTGKWNSRPIVYWNDGNGEYSNDTRLVWNRNPVDFAVGDVDLDGDLDIVMGSYSTSNPNGRNMLYSNDGDRTFTNIYIDSGVRERTGSVSLGDVDGDGYLDLIETNNSEPDTYRLYDSSTGRFNSTEVEFGGGADTNTYGGVAGDVDGDGDIDYIAGFLNGQNVLYENLGFDVGTTNKVVSDPATVTIQVGLLKNGTFKDNYENWDMEEAGWEGEQEQEVQAGTFAIVSGGTTVEEWTAPGANALYDYRDGNMQDQYSWELPYTIPGADPTIALHTNNAPMHTWLSQVIYIPDIRGLVDVELSWDMAYWNHYIDPDTGAGAFDHGTQHVAVYVYQVDDPTPQPLWISTTGDDKSIVLDAMRNFSADIPSDLIGEKVRVVVEVSSLRHFFEVAVDDIRIVPTWSGSATDPEQPDAPDLRSQYGPDDGLLDTHGAGGVPIPLFTVDADSAMDRITGDTASDSAGGDSLMTSTVAPMDLSVMSALEDAVAAVNTGTPETAVQPSAETSQPQSSDGVQAAVSPDGATDTGQGSAPQEDTTTGSAPAAQSPDLLSALLNPEQSQQDQPPAPDASNPVEPQTPTALIFDLEHVSATHVLALATPLDSGTQQTTEAERLAAKLTTGESLTFSLDTVRLTEIFT